MSNHTTDERYFEGAFLQPGEQEPLELGERRPVSYFWFPWDTTPYTSEFCKRKARELIDSGEYWGVRQVFVSREFMKLPTGKWDWVPFCTIDIKLAKDQYGDTVWDRREVEQ
ncbi:MAG: hypothetical protein GWN58_27535 [Anaerolineae bacterium]|nr:hypothetical protein [Anaerolineae bacterium]